MIRGDIQGGIAVLAPKCKPATMSYEMECAWFERQGLGASVCIGTNVIPGLHMFVGDAIVMRAQTGRNAHAASLINTR